MADPNGLRRISRLITTHNSEGKAIFSDTLSELTESTVVDSGAAHFTLGYCTEEFPVDLGADKDVGVYSKYLAQAPGLSINTGTVLRFVDVGPGHVSPMHRTVSLDYGVVIEGDVELILDSGETRPMARGDVAIQRGTMHAWKNRSKTEWARMMYVLMPCKPIELESGELGEDLATMSGVRQSS